MLDTASGQELGGLVFKENASIMKVKSNYTDNMLPQWPGSTAYVQESEGNTMMGGTHLMSHKVRGRTQEQTSSDCGCWEERCGMSQLPATEGLGNRGQARVSDICLQTPNPAGEGAEGAVP